MVEKLPLFPDLLLSRRYAWFMSIALPESVVYFAGGFVGGFVGLNSFGDSGLGVIREEGDVDFPPIPAVELCLPSLTPFGNPTCRELKSPEIAAAMADDDPSLGLFSPCAARRGNCLGAAEDMSNWY